MMREIRFRAKQWQNNKWIYGWLFSDDTGTYIKPSGKKQTFITGIGVDPETVGQYIDLKDKNGVDIYEGDILHYSFDDIDQWFGVVVFDVEYASFRIKHAASHIYGNHSFNPYIVSTTIGNIHQNPELLTNNET